MHIRPEYAPPAFGEETASLILRDRSRAPIWRVLPEDAQRVETFLRDLSAKERRDVARALATPEERWPEFVRGLGGTNTGKAVLVEAPRGDVLAGFGAYRRLCEDEAAIAIAVAREWRDLGLGRLLLDRLARLAAKDGFDRLRGITASDDPGVVGLFRESGFAVVEEGEDETDLTVDLSKVTGELGRPGEIGGGAFAEVSLRPLLSPRSVAVVGASRSPTGVGHRILKSLLQAGLEGTVYPVNPKAKHVASIRAWSSASAIGEPIDLAVIAVPADAVPEVVEDCARAGVRALVVVSAGFGEIGEVGAERQRALLETVRRHGMRLVGPNCLGVLHTDPGVRLNASFAPRMPPAGRVALCSQSGALGIVIIALARRLELGLSSFVSVGNKADVADDDLLEYWEEDPLTDILLFYVESFARPRRFGRIARRVSRSKPIVVVKSGRSQAGGRAAGSHTGALVGGDVAVDTLFRQVGILRASTLDEMFGIARALTGQPLPQGRRFAVLTNAGGPAILCADALEVVGLEVPRLSDELQDELSAFLPSVASTANPVDMIASAGPDAYARVVPVLLASDEVDGLVVIYTPTEIFETGEIEEAVMDGVAEARERGAGAKPIYASVVGGEEIRYVLGRKGDGIRLPAYPFPEEIGRVAAAAVRYAEWRAASPGVFPDFEDQNLDAARAICYSALEFRGDGWLSVTEAREVLELAGLQVAPGGVARSPDEAAEIADRLRFPVAVKLASIEIAHKTEIGGVKLGMEDADAVRRGFVEVRERLETEGKEGAMEGVLVQPMLEGSAEVMLGMSQDPSFGPVLAFGLGGIHVEILRDVSFRVAPLTDRDAREMIRETRGYPLLTGYRGHPSADIDALEEALLRLSCLVDAVEEIRELDLNPVFALEPGDGYQVVDARLRVAAPDLRERS